MGLFDRFKKDNSKKEEPKEEKVIPDNLEIDEDQLILKEIATNSKDRYERAAAADQITDQYVALDMSKTIKDRAIRLIAVNKVKDEKLLRDAAENSPFFDVRSFAWERLGENNKSIARIDAVCAGFSFTAPGQNIYALILCRACLRQHLMVIACTYDLRICSRI